MELEFKEEDCSQARKDWVVSDMVRTILKDAGYEGTADRSLVPRGSYYYEGKARVGAATILHPITAVPLDSGAKKSLQQGSENGSQLKSADFEILCLPIFHEHRNVMVPCGIMSTDAGSHSLALNGTDKLVSIPARNLRQLLLDKVDDITLWLGDDERHMVYALVEVNRQLLLDADDRKD